MVMPSVCSIGENSFNSVGYTLVKICVHTYTHTHTYESNQYSVLAYGKQEFFLENPLSKQLENLHTWGTTKVWVMIHTKIFAILWMVELEIVFIIVHFF